MVNIPDLMYLHLISLSGQRHVQDSKNVPYSKVLRPCVTVNLNIADMASSLEELHDDVLIHLFGFLRIMDILNMRQVGMHIIDGKSTLTSSFSDLKAVYDNIKAARRLEACLHITCHREWVSIS